MFDNIERTAVFIRDCIRDIPERHKQNKDRLQHLQHEENDIRHLIELGKLNGAEIMKLNKDYRKLLQERRKLKGENELLEPLANSIKKFKGNLAELDKVIGDIRKIQGTLERRTYTCRVRTDLQDKF